MFFLILSANCSYVTQSLSTPPSSSPMNSIRSASVALIPGEVSVIFLVKCARSYNCAIPGEVSGP